MFNRCTFVFQIFIYTSNETRYFVHSISGKQVDIGFRNYKKKKSLQFDLLQKSVKKISSSKRVWLNIDGQSSVLFSREGKKNHLKMARKYVGSRSSLVKVDSRSAKC